MVLLYFLRDDSLRKAAAMRNPWPAPYAKDWGVKSISRSYGSYIRLRQGKDLRRAATAVGHRWGREEDVCTVHLLTEVTLLAPFGLSMRIESDTPYKRGEGLTLNTRRTQQ